MLSRCLAAMLAASLAVPAIASAVPPPLTSKWPRRTLELGLADQPGGAAALRSKAHVGFRYQYLAGGVNTASGWSTWNPDGSFVTLYVDESRRAGQVPVFTYFQLQTSKPGGNGETDNFVANLRNVDTMRAYYADLKLFFQRAAATKGPVVLHVEPDLWGFVEQTVKSGDASDLPANVASTGVDGLGGLPDNVAGFAQAIVRLRDRYAPNVVLGYHLSQWGTGVDVALQDPPDKEVDVLAHRAAAFYRSLHADFDVTFAEFDDRDSGFNYLVGGDGGASWFKPVDFTRHARFLRGYDRASGQRIVVWQIPLGNTLMRAMDNSWGHYQDNRVQTLLGGGSKPLRRYRDAGVIAFLFGGGTDGTTCACDARHDGKTNPKPVNGNRRRSLSADDDGGYFASRSRAYYRRGALKLPR